MILEVAEEGGWVWGEFHVDKSKSSMCVFPPEKKTRQMKKLIFRGHSHFMIGRIVVVIVLKD
jgi:hypothetical protein